MELLPNTAILKKFEFLHPFSKALRKQKQKKTCFALDHLYIELKKKSLFTMTSNVFAIQIQFAVW